MNDNNDGGDDGGYSHNNINKKVNVPAAEKKSKRL